MSRDCLFLGTNCGGPNVRGLNVFGTKWDAAPSPCCFLWAMKLKSKFDEEAQLVDYSRVEQISLRISLRFISCFVEKPHPCTVWNDITVHLFKKVFLAQQLEIAISVKTQAYLQIVKHSSAFMHHSFDGFFTHAAQASQAGNFKNLCIQSKQHA